MRFFNNPKDRIKLAALKRAFVDFKTVFFAPSHSHYIGVDLFTECSQDPQINPKVKAKFLKLSQRVIQPDFRKLCHRDPYNNQWSAPDQIEQEFGHDVEFMRAINRTLAKNYWK